MRLFIIRAGISWAASCGAATAFKGIDVTGRGGYTLDHSIGYYAIDGQCQMRVLFRQEHPVADLVQHLRLLLDE